MARLSQDEVNGLIAHADQERYEATIAEYDDWSIDDLRQAVEDAELIADDDDVYDYDREALIRLLAADAN